MTAPSSSAPEELPISGCPFCGSVAPTVKLTDSAELGDDDWDSNMIMHTVVCDASRYGERKEGGCGATGGFAFTKEEAIDRWNKRCAPSETVATGETPRTDAELRKHIMERDGWEFARQLERERDEIEAAAIGYVEEIFAANNRAEVAEAENAALKRDAERYRWLNANHNFMMYVESEDHTKTHVRLRCGEPLDQWIDAAINATKEKA